MTVDFNTDCYDPVYAVLGVPATMTVGATEVELTVIDKTRREDHDKRRRGNEQRRAWCLGPHGRACRQWDHIAATGRCVAGLQWPQLDRSQGDVLGSPNGEDLGQVRLLLKEAAVG